MLNFTSTHFLIIKNHTGARNMVYLHPLVKSEHFVIAYDITVFNYINVIYQ